ncbi:MAG: BrnA antitoxin family protein [Calditrichia bacterium]
MKEQHIIQYSTHNLAENNTSDWERLKSMNEDDIDFSDIPELDEKNWDLVEIVYPTEKKRISLYIDADILDFFKEQGKGYQTRMNAVLRSYVSAKRRKRTKTT